MKIITARSIAPGDEVEIAWADRDDPVTAGGRVAYVRAGDDGLTAGVEFHHALGAAAFRGLEQRRGGRGGDPWVAAVEGAYGARKRLA